MATGLLLLPVQAKLSSHIYPRRNRGPEDDAKNHYRPGLYEVVKASWFDRTEPVWKTLIARSGRDGRKNHPSSRRRQGFVLQRYVHAKAGNRAALGDGSGEPKFPWTLAAKINKNSGGVTLGNGHKISCLVDGRPGINTNGRGAPRLVLVTFAFHTCRARYRDRWTEPFNYCESAGLGAGHKRSRLQRGMDGRPAFCGEGAGRAEKDAVGF